MGRLYNDGLELIAEGDGGRITWSSVYAPAALLPDTETVTYSGNVVFPDFIKGNLATFSLQTISEDPFIQVSYAASWATILPGYYGPDEGGAYTIARTLIGSLPAGTDYIDARLTASRSGNPSTFRYVAVPKAIKENAECFMDGGCATLEKTYAFVRGIRLNLIGTDLYLERHMSVASNANAGTPMKSDPQVWSGGAISPWHAVFTHGGTPTGHLAYELDRKDSSGNINKQRGGSNQPSFTDASNYQSTWPIDLVVRPGILRA